MITANQAKQNVASIDWVKRCLDDISKHIDDLSSCGYSSCHHAFSSVIPHKDVKKIIRELRKGGFSVEKNKSISGKILNQYKISWAKEIGI